jgi:hypothetical protein
MRRRLTVLTATVIAVLWCAGGASASPGWVVQATVNTTSGFNVLGAVSCPSTTSCTAVGWYSNSSGVDVPLAEYWNGSTWAMQTVPAPAGQVLGLQAVSCVSTADCTAVGSYTASSGDLLSLAEYWNGSTWAIQATPNPSNAAETYLNGVSCVSASSCMAVGSYTNAGSSKSLTLAEHWNGSAWAIQTTPHPGGEPDSSLNSVSCLSATSCTAAGHGGKVTDYVALVMHWNGTRWSIQSTPIPSGATSSAFYGVSCSGGKCTAAGFSGGSGGTVTLAEYWNGSAWAIETTPNPSGASGIVLYGISCHTATICTAAGEYFTSGGSQDTLAEYRNGSTWVIQSTPNPSSAVSPINDLGGVSCPSATECTAVGDYANSANDYLTLAEHD